MLTCMDSWGEGRDRGCTGWEAAVCWGGSSVFYSVLHIDELHSDGCVTLWWEATVSWGGCSVLHSVFHCDASHSDECGTQWWEAVVSLRGCSVLHSLLQCLDTSIFGRFVGLFCKRALQKRQYSANETYNFIDPTDRSHPLVHEKTLVCQKGFSV